MASDSYAHFPFRWFVRRVLSGSRGAERPARYFGRRTAGIFALVSAITVSLVQAPPALAAKPANGQHVQREASVKPGPKRPAAALPANLAAAAELRKAPAVTWPVASDQVVDMAPARAATVHKAVRVTGSPVTLDAPVATTKKPVVTPAKVRVRTLDHASAAGAGFPLMVELSRADSAAVSGQVNLSVSYATFAKAYGADWGSRLRLEMLPGCALTTPTAAACAAVPLESANNRVGATVTSTVSLPATGAVTLALTSGSSSDSGNFTATPLKPASTWSAGGQSGDFGWSYPMRVPPGLGGPEPDIALAYSSQSVDGEMAATNNQPGSIGEGFSYSPGSVTRSYKACADDMGGTATNKVKTGDLCWGGYNATLSLSGHSGELIKDDGNGSYHLKNDDSTKVELLTPGATSATNPDNDGEYWRVTTTDGTRYYFGRNRLFGWVTGNPVTNSVNTVPVFGNNPRTTASGPDEPCYNATFASASCPQAWQWNLDYVVDAHGNTESFWYTPETNHYARNSTATSVSTYTRGSYLTRIDYGTDERTNGTDSGFSTKAPMTVDFGNADRCIPDSVCDTAHPNSWPDVPWDQSCTSTTNCKDHYSATFFTQKRLDTVKTSVWNATSKVYDPVEQWTLHQSYPDPGDTTRAGLWLDSISHKGLYGTTAPDPSTVIPAADVPDVKFTGIQMQNRVDTATDNTAKMNWWRISSILTESGELIGVNYSPTQCVAGATPAADNNTKRCYPVYWTRPTKTTPTVDWFHKYVVTAVTEDDQTGGAPRTYTAYAYDTTNPMWHYDDDNGLVPASQKTWAQWRGYSTVTTTKGELSDPKTQTKTLYYQGMNGDKTSTGTRTATVVDSTGAATADDDAFAGQVREQITNNGPNGDEVSGTINDAWKSTDATATRTVAGYTKRAYHTGISATYNRTDLDRGRTPQRTETDTKFDSYGMPTQVFDKGDTSTSADDVCTINTYNRNTDLTILDTIGRVQKYAKPCGTNPAGEDDVIADAETSFDGNAYAAIPTKGDITSTQTAKTWSTSSIGWLTLGTSVYDPYGRVIDSADVRGNHTLTAYTPVSGGPVTATSVTKNPLGWVSTTQIAPGYGLTTASVDANGKRSDTTYDALGRQTAIWTPTRSKANKVTANATFSYQISQSVPSAVSTNVLDAAATYVPRFTLYDGLLRPRQTQQLAIGGGRTITDTFYNSLGETTKVSGPYYNSDGPVADLSPTPADDGIPGQSTSAFDGAGRTIRTSYVSFGNTQWHTTTAYGGDHTDVTPAADAAAPTGGSPASTITDALGRTVELRQYPGTAVTGTAYNATKYAFNEKGQNTGVTDGAGNTWGYTYDLLGRTIAGSDPDTGATHTTYNDYGDVTSTTNANQQVISYDYKLPAGYADPLGRPTSRWLGAVTTGTKLASWTYDTVSKGHPTSTSRWVGTSEYKTDVIGYNSLYEPAGTITTIPASEGSLAGTYQVSATYNLDGTVNSQTIPTTADLVSENLNYAYDKETGHPYSLKTDYGGTSAMMVLSTQYTSYGEPGVTTFADSLTAPWVQQSLTYEKGTRRLAEAETLKSTSPTVVGDVHYSYDAAGDVLKAADTPSDGSANTQCFTYDDLQRLSSAWTPANGDCATAPATANLGGAAPYWKSWTFDGVGVVASTGNRLTETTHAGTGDKTVTSAYAQAGHAHGVSATVTTVGGAQTGSASYAYDAAGNTISRPGANGQQTLRWDPEGHLSSVTDGSGTSSYVYNSDGTRLVAHDATGTTLYIGDVLLHLSAGTGAKTAQRYYTFNGQTVAQRTTAGLQFLTSDPHGTSTIAVDDTAAQAVVKRYQDPYGNAIGPDVTWTGARSFVGGDQDPTSLIHLGAREYDAALGRFISPDPIIDNANPQQINGYAYADDNPIGRSDPSGLWAKDPDLDDQFGRPKQKGTGHSYHQSPPGSPAKSHSPVYTPISAHVVARTDDPHYKGMTDAYKDMLAKVKARPGHMPYVQEMGIWHQICVSHAYGEGVCPSGMESSLRDSIDGAGFAGAGEEMSNLDGNSTYLVSPDLKSGGAASVILTIFYKPGWSAAQRAAADAKVRALNAANLVVTKVVRNGSARAMAKAAGMTIADDEHADHTIELQLGGADDASNIRGLNYSVNTSMGNQIKSAIKRSGLQAGDPVDGVAIMDRPGYTFGGDGAAGGGGE